MPITDWELWACANEVIRQHGDKAVDHAAVRAVELEAAGDSSGQRIWLAILYRIDQPQSQAANTH